MELELQNEDIDSRLRCYCYCLLIPLFLLMSGKSFAQIDKPNIIILLADDLGYGDTGVYGAEKILTPNIDILAQQGMYFTDAHSPGSTCTPSRYAILTGRYYWRDRSVSEGGYGYATPRIKSTLTTLPEFLRENGYHTAAVGKWHLGLRWGLKKGTESVGKSGENIDFHKAIKDGPLQHGFDYYFGIPASLDMPPYVFIENDRTVGIPNVEKNPKNTLQWDRGGLMVPHWKDEAVGPTLIAKAESFIQDHIQQQPDRPFFLYFAASAPHTPAVPPDFIQGKSEAGTRGDMVAEFDWSVGKIVQLLDRLKLKENTLIIVTSDNGALTTGPKAWADEPLEKYDINHHGHTPNGILRGQKADIWEGGHRVPFIARWPSRIPDGSINRDVVSLVDLYATFANVLNDSVPPTAQDSYNILPALVGLKMDDQRVLIHHAERAGDLYAIRKGPWKLIEGRGSGGLSEPVELKPKEGEPAGQLYNLKTDLSESINLWNSRHKIVQQLRKSLFDKKSDGVNEN